jgi:hypothetical protein
MELDTGNTTALFVGNHIAPLVGLKPDSTGATASLTLANGIVVSGPARTANLIMDGNLGADFLKRWITTIDLAHGRVWLAPAPSEH